jgi:hypothetical protein
VPSASHLTDSAETRGMENFRLHIPQSPIRTLSFGNLGLQLSVYLLELGGPFGDPLLQCLVQTTQFGFDLLALGDIPGDLRGTDNLAALSSDRRDGQRNGNLAALLVAPYRFVMLYLFAPCYLIEDNGHLVLATRCGQQKNRLSDDLLWPIPEDRFGSLIPGCNRPI